MLLDFAPPKEKAAHGEHTGTAKKNKLHNHSNEIEALKQALEAVKMYHDTVFRNLIARTCHQYLSERGLYESARK